MKVALIKETKQPSGDVTYWVTKDGEKVNNSGTLSYETALKFYDHVKKHLPAEDTVEILIEEEI